jgi:hypothetical protein
VHASPRGETGTPTSILTPRKSPIVLALGAALALALWLAPGAGAAGAAPKLMVLPPLQHPGSPVTVVGQGFPVSSTVQVQICGNNDLDGSTDCALGGALNVVATGEGQFEAPMIVTIPPKPCPCVLAALDFSLGTTPTASITILGAPTAAPAPATLVKLQVVSAAFEGAGPWTSWFGGGAARTLVLTVHNPNPVPYVRPSLILSFGPLAHAQSDEATALTLDSIAAGGSKTYRIPLTFPAFSVGDQRVAVLIGNAGFSRGFTVGTRVFPWGLLIVLLVLVELALFGVTGLFRERHRRRHDAEPSATPSGSGRTEAGSGDSSRRLLEPAAHPQLIGETASPTHRPSEPTSVPTTENEAHHLA